MKKKYSYICSQDQYSLKQDILELIQARYLLKMLVWRDLRVRYSHTVLGVFWNILQPLALMLIFVGFLGFFFKGRTYNVPSPVYIYSALCLWQFFSRCLSQGGGSLDNFYSILAKIYFPRMIAPLSMVMGASIDFIIALALLFPLQAYYGCFNFAQFLWAPIVFFCVFLFGLGLSLLLSGLNSKFKDITHLIPILTQIWIFSTPIMYPLELVPERWHWLYSLNPMVGYIEWFRWAITRLTPMPSNYMLACSFISTGFILILGVWYFRKCSGTLIDTL